MSALIVTLVLALTFSPRPAGAEDPVDDAPQNSSSDGKPNGLGAISGILGGATNEKPKGSPMWGIFDLMPEPGDAQGTKFSDKLERVARTRPTRQHEDEFLMRARQVPQNRTLTPDQVSQFRGFYKNPARKSPERSGDFEDRWTARVLAANGYGSKENLLTLGQALKPDLSPNPSLSQAKRPNELYIPKGFLSEYAERKPSDPWPPYVQGIQFSDQGDQQSAYDSFSRALELGGKGTDLLVAHASAANAIGMHAEALASAERALRSAPTDDRALAQRMFARSSISRSETVTTIEHEAKGPAKLPKSGKKAAAPPRKGPPTRDGYAASKRLLREAEGALAKRDWKKAAELATEALRVDPESAPAYNRRAHALNRMKRYEDAAGDAGSALALDPADRERVRAHLHRALAFNHLGRFEEARQDARDALRLAKANPLALGLLAWSEAGLGDRSASLRALADGARSSEQLARLREQALALPEGTDLAGVFADGFDLEPADETAGKDAPAAGGGLPWWWALAAVLGGLAGGWGLSRASAKPPVEWTPMPAAPPSERKISAEPLKGFETLGTLGRGGMGVVELARDSGTGRLVALKRMREEIRRDPRERERIVREARIVAKLSHPGIVSVYEVRESEDDVVIVFEHVEGRSLSEILSEEGRVPPEQAAAWAEAIAEAVDHAHAKGIVHRDLKPGNVMIDADGVPRVMDFGIARAAADAMTRLTGTVAASGTPPYMAPEQEEGLARRESDVFALGVCLYEMLTGELPFPGMGYALHLQKREGRFVPVSQRLPGAAAGDLDAVFERALAPDPAKRFPSAKAFSDALRVALTV